MVSTARPVVVAVAITGSVPRKKDNPALPTTPSEQIESTHAAYLAGATLAHIHVRNPDESPSSDPALFAQVQEGLRKHCPGMIVQFSTGGRGRDQAARGSSLPLKPDMASLSTGSVNFPTIVYENATALVEDLAGKMHDARHPAGNRDFRSLAYSRRAPARSTPGSCTTRPHVQFVMGVKNAMPAEEHLLDILLNETRRVLPKATWTAAGIGVNQSRVMEWALARKRRRRAHRPRGQHPHCQGSPRERQRRAGRSRGGAPEQIRRAARDLRGGAAKSRARAGLTLQRDARLPRRSADRRRASPACRGLAREDSRGAGGAARRGQDDAGSARAARRALREGGQNHRAGAAPPRRARRRRADGRDLGRKGRRDHRPSRAAAKPRLPAHAGRGRHRRRVRAHDS